RAGRRVFRRGRQACAWHAPGRQDQEGPRDGTRRTGRRGPTSSKAGPRSTGCEWMTETSTPAVVMYTDGACKGNPGRGGWGVWMVSGPHEKEMWGGELLTTNNRMELTAVIQALSALKRRCKVIVYTDSEYVRKGITEWIGGWKRRGWK